MEKHMIGLSHASAYNAVEIGAQDGAGQKYSGAASPTSTQSMVVTSTCASGMSGLSIMIPRPAVATPGDQLSQSVAFWQGCPWVGLPRSWTGVRGRQQHGQQAKAGWQGKRLLESSLQPQFFPVAQESAKCSSSCVCQLQT